MLIMYLRRRYGGVVAVVQGCGVGVVEAESEGILGGVGVGFVESEAILGGVGVGRNVQTPTSV
jgi:hypothetical protein